MSLWTPGGEVPVERNRGGQAEPEPRSAPGGQAPAISEEALAEAAAAAGIDLADLSPDERAQLEAMMLEMAEVQAQLASTPAAQVILNHMRGFYDLAGIHLSQAPPNFDEASLAIDAMAAVLDALEPRLGDEAPVMRHALSQLQAAFVELRRRAAEA
ncbi:MAG: hypothetical protein ACXWCB_06565 [Acidimicrobiales bacterium]